MKRENVDHIFRTCVSFFALSSSLLPSMVLAFDLSSVYERGAQSFNQVKGAAKEIFHDNLTFDDAAIKREVEPLLTTLKEARRIRVNKINELMRTNRPLAIDLEQQEARRYCDIFPIEVQLLGQIEKNCKIMTILKTCEAQSSSTIVPWANKVRTRIADSSKGISIPKMIKLERELVNAFRIIQKANKTCSDTYRSSLLHSECKNTYRNFFADFQEEIVNNCSENSVIEALDRFVVEMRDFNHSSRVHLSKALTIHSESRNAEINLARTIEQINTTRLRLEHAAGKGPSMDLRQPAEQPAQLENYKGS